MFLNETMKIPATLKKFINSCKIHSVESMYIWPLGLSINVKPVINKQIYIVCNGQKIY